MNTQGFLSLHPSYSEYLGGLRWSALEDALERSDGSTFAFSSEAALFIEGFASSGRMIHFGFLLHLLELLRGRAWEGPPETFPLRRTFVRCRGFIGAAGALRNAGAFCAELCRDVPDATGPVHVRQVLELLREPVRQARTYIVSIHDIFYASEMPPLEPAAFEEQFLRKLAAYTPEELHAWLHDGRGPVKEAAQAIAQALPLRTLTGALASLLNRPRLAGARHFLTQLRSALALPPRRRLQPHMPLGGYADVATHGQPHELLPSQFALDEWDFLRRFADHELLFFRREEPHQRAQHELVVLLDQGVRTWGDVRVVLSAAVLALGRQAEQAKMRFLVTATSAEGRLLDPVEADPEELGQMVEASDLSPSPGLALERLLEQPAALARDVVLLTHPRSLREEEVRAAALGARGETRLLALALDGHGQATLSELRRGVPVPLRQFHVDFTPSPVVVPPPEPLDGPGPWYGDVEPIGFPFRFGTDGPRTNWLCFDYGGDWLFTASDGAMHIWKTDGTGSVEVLPRPMVEGRLIATMLRIVGVMGGFVIVAKEGKREAAVHYDLSRRTCTVHFFLNERLSLGDCRYAAEHHSIVVVDPDRPQASLALDLRNSTSWTHAFWTIAKSVPSRRLICMNLSMSDFSPIAEQCPSLVIDPKTGEVRLGNVDPPWVPFTPLADGKPVLQGCAPVLAECRGNILALLAHPLKAAYWPYILRLFQGPHGIPLAEYSMSFGCRMTLSEDGNLLALAARVPCVEVVETARPDRPRLKTFAGRFSSQTQLFLRDRELVLLSGNHNVHHLRWYNGILEARCTRDRRYTGRERLLGEDSQWTPGTAAGLPAMVRYDRRRFLDSATTTVTAVRDRFGQVAILDAKERLVCMFFVFRDRLSGWLPDGTCFGPASAIGNAPTPAILEKFGSALARASDLGAKECK